MDTITWPDLPAVQQPPWPDALEVERAVAQLRAMPPLVFAGECDLLTERLAQASRGEAFVLTGGDCAETFEANTAESIRARLKTVLQMSVVLTYAASLPVVKMGRLAGQYFKPRSKTIENRDGVELTSYLGDAVNALPFDPESRRPDPQRLLQAYHASSSALNLVRAFTQGGYADLRQVHAWNQDFVRDSTAGQRYEQLAQHIDRALAFMQACGTDPAEFERVEFYAAHEALSMDYERALTRIDSRTTVPRDLCLEILEHCDDRCDRRFPPTSLTFVDPLGRSAMTAFAIASTTGSHFVLQPTRPPFDAGHEVFGGSCD